MGKRVLITGGTGLIGRALSASLAADGHEVIVLSRNPQRAAGLPPGVRTERWDARTAVGWGALADGAHAVVNLAGESISAGRWTAERKRATERLIGRGRLAQNGELLVIPKSAWLHADGTIAELL